MSRSTSESRQVCHNDASRPCSMTRWCRWSLKCRERAPVSDGRDSTDAHALRLAHRARENRDELGVVDEITLGQAARLLRQTIKPFQAALRDPFGGALHTTRDEIEAGTDADADRGTNCGSSVVEKELLLR